MIGRIRTVKPEIFSDEKLWDLSVETGLPLLQAFEGLWCYADREGRFEWRPRALKTLILPYWEGDFARALEALERARYVVRYTVDGQTFGVVRNFAKHQRVNLREAPSALPPPPATTTHVHARAELSPVPESSTTVDRPARGEGNGTELEGKGVGTELARAPVEVPGLEIVYPGPLQPSKRERRLDAQALALNQLIHKYPPDFEPTKANQVRGHELGLTDEEIWQRWFESKEKLYPHGFDDPEAQFNRELAWAKADKEKRMFKTRSERDAFETPGRERRPA
jgi:hypothetical protein